MAENKNVVIVKYGEQDEYGEISFMEVNAKAFDSREDADKFILAYAKYWFGKNPDTKKCLDDLLPDGAKDFKSTEDLADALIMLEEDCIPSFDFEILDPDDPSGYSHDDYGFAYEGENNEERD